MYTKPATYRTYLATLFAAIAFAATACDDGSGLKVVGHGDHGTTTATGDTDDGSVEDDTDAVLDDTDAVLDDTDLTAEDVGLYLHPVHGSTDVRITLESPASDGATEVTFYFNPESEDVMPRDWRGEWADDNSFSSVVDGTEDMSVGLIIITYNTLPTSYLCMFWNMGNKMKAVNKVACSPEANGTWMEIPAPVLR